jgi:Protein of unknown function (DUF3617)
MKLSAKAAFTVLLIAMSGGLQGQVRMRAGLWENTVTSNGSTATRNACITPEQEEHSKGTVESMRESIEKALAKSGSCKLKEFTVTGANRTEVMVCGKTTIKNSTTFHGDSFETTATSTTAEGVKSSSIKGRRIGDCPTGGSQ